ncbi:DUF4435 domain-containing protein [Bacillus paralicheniformis]|uniref:DUF4435 domain-containing protein n=1 Tax=Bacillus paralicheniformis TaxID=1648923 RepID=UPI002867C794|nr:DUF4435 domain-containing protein [Bacillus paralicheniformis]WMW47704.1 DUF4435 domain-containing protein [Bacillus paralicheniformis]
MAITKEFMKKSLKDKSVAWMDFSGKNSRDYPEFFHCFFEGEDRKYYLDRIEYYTHYTLESVVGYNCNGKDNVIQIWRKIVNNPKYKKISTAFFIDKDYGIESYKTDEKVYITPYHSLENFYVNTKSFEKLIVKEFELNPIDDDYNKVRQDFNSRHKEFQDLISPLNAFIISCLKVNLKINIQKFNIDDFMEIKIDGITVRNEINFDNLKKYYLKKLEADVKNKKRYAEDNLSYFKELIDKVECSFFRELQNVINNKDSLIHGKMELYFFKNIIESMKKYNTNNKYFSRNRSGVKVDIQSSNILSNLSQYALTPNCLVDFLKKYQYVCKIETAN